MQPGNPLIPRHITLYLGGLNDHTGRFYVLWRDGKILVIQATPQVPADSSSAWDYEAIKRQDRDWFYELERIQSLGVEFGRTNWGFLIDDGGGNIRINYKEKVLPNLSLTTWAPLVDLKDINITALFDSTEFHGVWNGREVDLYITWDYNFSGDAIERATKGHRLLAGLNVTYEVLGHVLHNGRLVGIMTEAALGRMVQRRDRTIVYNAIARIQNHGLYFGSITSSNIMISNEVDVRLLSVPHVTSYAEYQLHKSVEKKLSHLEQLELMFEELLAYGNPINPVRSRKHTIFPLPTPPSPELPRFRFRDCGISPYDWSVLMTIQIDEEKRPRKYRRASEHANRLLVRDSERIEDTPISDPRVRFVHEEEDSPVGKRALRLRANVPWAGPRKKSREETYQTR